MSDINLVVLSGRLKADAVFTEKSDGEKTFVSVRMRLTTTDVFRKLNSRTGKSETTERSTTHAISTTINSKPELVKLWKERCVKDARIHLQGSLVLDIVEKPGAPTAYYSYVHARSNLIVLPEPRVAKKPAPSKQQSPQHTAPAQLQGRSDALNF